MSTYEKLATLKQKLVETETNNTGTFNDCVIFISIGNENSRAYVLHAKGSTIEEAFANAVQLIRPYILRLGQIPWIKIDLVTEVKKYTETDFLKYVSTIKRNYFREGISFDRNFSTAFLEQEVNANNFIQGLKEEKPKAYLSMTNINHYLKNYRFTKKTIEQNKIKEIYTFKTISYFMDKNQLHELHNGPLNNGVRKIGKIDLSLLYDVINRSSLFLKKQVDDSGKFRYGYFPAFNKEINTYNILRHASTTYSMVEAFEVTDDPSLLDAIKRALKYLVENAIEIVEVDGDKRAFVLEKEANNEIKLGANAHALLAMTKYTAVCSDSRYLDIMKLLAKGIEYFQDKENGSFVHVLNFPDLTVKDKFRTIYYDGEAAFALMRFFALNKEEYWLHIVEKAMEYFIAKEYWKYGDHWMSYASNEMFRQKPLPQYAQLNFKNVESKLDFCLTRETAYPTLLELLMASFNLYVYMEEKNLHSDLLKNVDLEKLQRAISHRTTHQLNSYFWPESAMYFKVPKNILNSFYIRHHSYRVRIDDIEHNISGYCNLLKFIKE